MDSCPGDGEPRFNMFLLPRDERGFEQGESAFSLVKRCEPLEPPQIASTPSRFLAIVDTHALPPMYDTFLLCNVLAICRACYTSYVDTFVKSVLSMPRRPFPRAITEREWCRIASEVWQLIADSEMLSSYAQATEEQYMTS